MVLQPFPSFARDSLPALHSPSTTMGPVDCQKMGTDLLGSEGGFKSLLWIPAGRGERQIIHSTSSLLKSVAIMVLVL